MLVRMNYLSEILEEEVFLNVILPEPRVLGINEADAPLREKLPVLYLLHGYHGGASDWQRKTSIEQFMHEAQKHMIIVTPGMNNFFYTNMVHGKRYFDFVADELPRVIQTYFNASDRREDTFVAGLSMGGYGAMKLALTYPERYGYAASFSGAVDCFNQKDLSEIQDPKMLAMRLAMQDELNWIFGPEEGRRGSKNDVMALLETCDASKAPKLYVSCGLDDDLYEGNVAFRDKARALGYDLTFYEQPATGHEWRFWNTEAEKLIKQYLPIK